MTNNTKTIDVTPTDITPAPVDHQVPQNIVPMADLDFYDPGEEAGRGLEDIQLDERKIPFLRILDPKSPQCKPTSQGGLPGARGGALLNTSTNQVYNGELGGEFIPAARDYRYVEYVKRNDDGSGGGFRAVHDPKDPKIQALREKFGKFGKLPMGETEDGQPLEGVQTFYLFGTFYPPNDDPFRCIVGFASTQIKKYTAFVERTDAFRYPGRLADGSIGRVKPALYVHRWHLATQYESKGAYSWYGWKLTLAEKNPDGSEKPKEASYLPKGDERRAAATEFFDMIQSGKVKPDYATASAEETTESAAPSPRPTTNPDDEIPF